MQLTILIPGLMACSTISPKPHSCHLQEFSCEQTLIPAVLADCWCSFIEREGAMGHGTLTWVAGYPSQLVVCNCMWPQISDGPEQKLRETSGRGSSVCLWWSCHPCWSEDFPHSCFDMPTLSCWQPLTQLCESAQYTHWFGFPGGTSTDKNFGLSLGLYGGGGVA